MIGGSKFLRADQKTITESKRVETGSIQYNLYERWQQVFYEQIRKLSQKVRELKLGVFETIDNIDKRAESMFDSKPYHWMMIVSFKTRFTTKKTVQSGSKVLISIAIFHVSLGDSRQNRVERGKV